MILFYDSGSEGQRGSLSPSLKLPTGNFFTLGPVRNLTGQPDNQSLTIYFVGDFCFVAKFLLGFGRIFQLSGHLNIDFVV